jgi:hypothetical protein
VVVADDHEVAVAGKERAEKPRVGKMETVVKQRNLVQNANRSTLRTGL